MNEATAAQTFNSAVAHHRAGRLDEAARLYCAVLKIAPDHFGALHYLGLACMQQRKFDEALTLLQRAVGLDPRSAEARTNFGIALAAVQRPEEAVVQYEHAVALQPDHVEARNNLGIALQALKRQGAAAAQFEAALKLKPDNVFVLNNVIDRLVEKGLINRNLSAADRRRHELTATARGRDLIHRIVSKIDRCERRILAPLSLTDQRKFLELASRLVQVNNVYSRAPMNLELVSESRRNSFAPPKRRSSPAKRLTAK